MSDGYSFDEIVPPEFDGGIDRVKGSTNALGQSALGFANAMTRAFAQASRGGKQFDDVLKSLALRLSSLAVTQALRPLAKDLGGGLSALLNGLPTSISDPAQTGGITPFAAGGVIGAPSYFPLSAGGLGLAGEAGPEAIMPLTRGPDGRLGVATNGAAVPHVTVQIATPDAGSFRRSEAYITGQIARAVARGQRGF